MKKHKLRWAVIEYEETRDEEMNKLKVMWQSRRGKNALTRTQSVPMERMHVYQPQIQQGHSQDCEFHHKTMRLVNGDLRSMKEVTYVKCWDSEFGTHYYWNEVHDFSTWDKPEITEQGRLILKKTKDDE